MAKPSGDYVLPPKDTVFSTLLRGLKTFSDDLQLGATDSSAFGYGWAQMPSAARIAAPQLLQPKPPNLALTLRTSNRPGPAVQLVQTARETATSLRHVRRPRSAGARQSFQRLPQAEVSQTPRRRPLIESSPEGQRRRGSGASREVRTLPPAKSCRQHSQKKLLRAEEAPPEKRMASTEPQHSSWESARGIPKTVARPTGQSRIGADEATAGGVVGAGAKAKAEEPGEQVFVARVQATKLQIATQAPQISPRTSLPAVAKQPRMMEDFIAHSSQHLLSLPGKPQLTWRTVDSEADYRELKSGEYFNHFFHNRVLTTKAGLAQSLKEYSISSGINAESFFPRCYDIAQKSDRDDFVLDYRRSAALRIALLHKRLHHDQAAMQLSDDSGDPASYSCNETILMACKRVLHRWCLDLDPKHLDEEGSDGHQVSEESRQSFCRGCSLAFQPSVTTKRISATTNRVSLNVWSLNDLLPNHFENKVCAPNRRLKQGNGGVSDCTVLLTRSAAASRPLASCPRRRFFATSTSTRLPYS